MAPPRRPPSGDGVASPEEAATLDAVTAFERPRPPDLAGFLAFVLLVVGPWGMVPGTRVPSGSAQEEDTSPASIGAPGNGRLRQGVAFPSRAPGFRSNPRRPNPTADRATPEVRAAILDAAAAVARAHPGAVLYLNDASLPGGGPIPHHGSHQAGRDVDVLFYLRGPDGEPTPPKGIPLDPQGQGWDFGELADPADDRRVRIDLPRTWAFLAALGSRPDLQRVFVVEHLRTLLLAEGARQGTPPALRTRLGHLMCQPRTPHDDHFHLRFFCDPGDLAAGCRDRPPVYPWWRRRLRAQGLEVAIARPRRPATRSRPGRSAAEARREARAAAGPLHARVEAFLNARETWASKPRTNRAWCR